MAESEHEVGSAFVSLKDKKVKTEEKNDQKKGNGHGKILKNQKKIKHQNPTQKKTKSRNEKRLKAVIDGICLIVLFIVFIVFFLIANYAEKNSCISVFWDYISEAGIQFVGVYGGIADVIFSAGWTFIPQREKDFNKAVFFGRCFFRILVLILAVFCLFTFFKIQGAIKGKEEEIVAQQEKMNADIHMSGTELSGENQLNAVVRYQIDQDLYMKERPLEEYYGREILDENREEVMAEILLDNLIYNEPRGSKTQNYNNLSQTADGEYKTYEYLKKYCDGIEDENEILFGDRIDMLQQSLDKREQANKEYNGPENERPLGTGYRDMGDEYLGREKQNEAIVAYEKSAEWFMKAIYHAAAIENYDEVETCMNKFKDLGDEVKKLNEIDIDRKDNILGMIEVYENFVSKVKG